MSGASAAGPPRRRIGPLVAWAFAIAVGIVGFLVTLYVRRGYTSVADAVWSPAVAVTFTTVGAMILTQRPGHTIGRLCLAIGMLLGLGVAFGGLAAFVDVRPGPMPPPFVAMAVWSGQLEAAGIVLLPALLVRFPGGALPGPRWRVIDIGIVAFLVIGALPLLAPGRASADWILPADNPIAIPGWPDTDALWPLTLVAGMAIVVSAVLSVIGLGQTYRRADSLMRAQVRWVLAPVGVFVSAIVVALFAGPLSDLAWPLMLIAPVLIPVGIGVAILRYHLYEIDRIVSRTIAYAAITAILGSVFIVANIAFQTYAAPALGGDTLGVALSTLLVASLVSPLRGRVQGLVDRRFNRARYDAERAATNLADRLRDEVDLDALRRQTLEAVVGTVQPARADMWLRPAVTPRAVPAGEV